MDAWLLAEYRKERAIWGCGGMVGHRAIGALERAKTNLQWDNLEELGLVSLSWEPDYDVAWMELEGKDKEIAERDGVWFLIGKYMVDGRWHTGGCIGGMVGTEDKTYAPDIKWETIDALVQALKSRCPRCRKGN